MVAKKLVSIRLSEEQINFVNGLNGASFSMKLCRLIDDYNFEELDRQRKQAENKIKSLKKHYVEMKEKLIKSTSKVEELIGVIKWE